MDFRSYEAPRLDAVSVPEDIVTESGLGEQEDNLVFDTLGGDFWDEN